MNDLIYTLPDSIGEIVFTPHVLEVMSSYKQTGLLKREAGGQLFAEFQNGSMMITEATIPRKKDLRSRFGFLPHRPSEQLEIHKKYIEAGLHFVGDWHTHPEATPSPSSTDISSVANMVNTSIALVIFCMSLVKHSIPNAIEIGALVVFIAMFIRFLKFYSSFQAEILRTFAFTSDEKKDK